MKRIVLLAVVLMISALAAQAQTPARPEENARIQPLLADAKKAGQARDAKLATLPESQAVRDAEKALEKANGAWQKAAESLPQYQEVKKAQASRDKSIEALNTAAVATAEDQAFKQAQAKLISEAFRILADNKLSSLEYRPEIDAAGNLVFAKVTPPKP